MEAPEKVKRDKKQPLTFHLSPDIEIRMRVMLAAQGRDGVIPRKMIGEYLEGLIAKDLAKREASDERNSKRKQRRETWQKQYAAYKKA